MADKPSGPAHEDIVQPVELHNPVLAAFLTWLVPGLGQAYQKRYAKAVLFFVCIMGTFLLGCYLGSDREYGVARVVYYSMRAQDRRYYFFPQAGIGVGAIPALIQAARVGDGAPPLLGGFMAPPALPGGQVGGPTLDDIVKKMPDHFEMGTIYTVIAGLLNLLAVFDALEGPVFIGQRRQISSQDADETDGSPRTAGA